MNRLAVMAIGALLWGGVLAGLALRQPAEPRYAGKPLSAWLDSGYEDLSMAVHEIGPAAAPAIYRKLRREHPQYGSRERYRRWWQRVPVALRALLPPPGPSGFDEIRACSALVDIGPSVLPHLIPGLRDGNPAVRLSSAWALAALRDRGVDLTPAIPALQEALRDPNPSVRKRAEWGLRQF